MIASLREGEPRCERQDGLRIFRIPVVHESGRPIRGVLWEYCAFTSWAFVLASRLAFTRRYDIVHVNNPPDFLLVTALVPRLLGARIIFDVHDLAPDLFKMRFGDRAYAGAADRAMRFVERLAAACADAVVTVHDPYALELRTRGVPAEKITVVLNSVDEAFLPTKPRAPAEGQFRIVYHGTMNVHYGIEMLVDAAAAVREQLPHVSIELYGAGDALPAVRTRVAAAGLEDFVNIHPRFLPLGEVLSRVQNASVGVVANLPIERNELVLPTKLFEYVAMRVPVVSCDLPTIRRHFSGGEVRFFEAGNVQALVDALLDVARDPVAAAMRADAAYERYREYRWGVSARRYAELLHRLAA